MISPPFIQQDGADDIPWINHVHTAKWPGIAPLSEIHKRRETIFKKSGDWN